MVWVPFSSLVPHPLRAFLSGLMMVVNRIDPDPEDFAAVEASLGPLPGENGSPAEAHYFGSGAITFNEQIIGPEQSRHNFFQRS